MDIILADDHKLVRDGLTPFLEELDDNVNVIEAAAFEHAMQASKEAQDLKLIILDLGMPGMNGLAGVRQMMETHPSVPVVILSGTHDQTAILKAFNLGIAGFIPKSAGSEVMMSALQLVMAGERYIPSQILVGAAVQDTNRPYAGATQAAASTRAINAARFDKLSKREQHVLELLAGGMTNKEIARTIDLQEATIKIHVKNIYRKMGVNNRVQAVRMVIEPDWSATGARLPH
ncbi:response regulator transcription factor [Magnetovibrio sp.]|uniref:response regulator transcription factor n=1 Tax=Magnetovibrio sp. TaxID=2024836 RepID=UPI002F92E77F